MKYQIKNETAAAEVILFGDIESFAARGFVQQLKAIGEKDLTIRINSYGGDFFSALAIYHVLKARKGNVTTIVDGVAASAASLIAIAGEVQMPENSWLMVHGLSSESVDTESLQRIEQSLVNAYVEKTGLSETRVRELMNNETWMNAAQSVALGFADKVIEPVAIAARGDLSRFKNLPEPLKSLEEPKTEPAVALEIINACITAGAPELAEDCLERRLTIDQVKALLTDPERISAARAHLVGDQVKEIYALCLDVGVPDLSERFIKEGRSVEWVQNRLKEAKSIRAICHAAKGLGVEAAENRGGAYIRAGVTLAEARHDLMEVLAALHGPEIDNKCFDAARPESAAAVGRETRLLNAAEIYARRNSPRGARADELANKLAEVITKHVK